MPKKKLKIKQPIRSAKIDNFIGIYDNYIPDAYCDSTIKLHEAQKKFNRLLNRQENEGASLHAKKDTQFFMNAYSIDIWWKKIKPLINNFDVALQHYVTTTGINNFYMPHLCYTTLKIQKTLPTEGYHVWHIENGIQKDNHDRVLAYTIYLNDVNEGGETEFLHQSCRVQPKKNRIVIWPSSFPYIHRGNPPLKGEKYILTSWMHVNPVES